MLSKTLRAVIGVTAIPLLIAGASLALPTGRPSPQGALCRFDPRGVPTGGCLFSLTLKGERRAFPLTHTDVQARISGNLARVEVTQSFENPYREALEAIYTFPLPDEAAVDEMEVRIGERVIRGSIKKRAEARRIYEEAKQQGRTAGLLEQERDNVFTQALANIQPGERIEVVIRYTESLRFTKGDYEFVFPLVVGPRYNPGGATALTLANPPVLGPGSRSGHDVSLTLDIDAGVPLAAVQSLSHRVRLDSRAGWVRVALADTDALPNKDFILRYRVAGERTRSTVLTQADSRGGHFAAYMIPALDIPAAQVVPRDVIFVMDTSGSQAGDPLVKSKELMRRFLNGLGPQDTFTIIDFANTSRALSAEPLANTPENRKRAFAYIDELQANGGTELMNGINAALAFPASPDGRLRSFVLLTDGLIGNDQQVIAAVRDRLKPGNRFYTFGVGSSVNRYLINRLADVGRGTAAVVRQDEPSAPAAEKFFRQLDRPVLTNIAVRWEGSGPAPDLYPAVPPDLFAGQPLVLFGRKPGAAGGRLHLTGIVAGGRRWEQTLDVRFPKGGNPAVAQLWGRARIKDLSTAMLGGETGASIEAVTDTALAYHLLSQYTAFVAVSDEPRVSTDAGRRRVVQPVELPEGMDDEKFLGGAAAQPRRTYASRSISPGPAIGAGQNAVQAPAQTPTILNSLASSPPPPPLPAPIKAAKTAEVDVLDESVTVGATRRRTPQQAKEVGPVYRIAPSQIESTGIWTLADARRGAAVPFYFVPPSLSNLVTYAPNLNEVTRSDLNKFLLASLPPQRPAGQAVFEIEIAQGKIVRADLLKVESTIKDRIFLDRVRRALLAWTTSAAPNLTTRLVLQF